MRRVLLPAFHQNPSNPTASPRTASTALLCGVLHHCSVVDDDEATEGPGQRLNALDGRGLRNSELLLLKQQVGMYPVTLTIQSQRHKQLFILQTVWRGSQDAIEDIKVLLASVQIGYDDYISHRDCCKRRTVGMVYLEMHFHLVFLQGLLVGSFSIGR